MTRRAAGVTGASSGIGRAVAAVLVELGYGLTLITRTGPVPDMDSLREDG